MLIIPAIYLSKGKLVSRYKGDPAHATFFGRSALSVATQFEKEGANTLHIVDVDIAASERGENFEAVKIITKKTRLGLQYADKTTSLEEIKELFDMGAACVSLNQFSEYLLDEALKRFGTEKIFFTIQARRNVVDGKQGMDVADYGKAVFDKGARHIIFRDIRAEGTLHPNFDEIEKLVLATQAKIYAFGGIGSMADLEILEKTGAVGAIISRAFLQGRLSLKECILRFGKVL